MSSKEIKIIGANEHNLKDVTVSIPKETLTVITGVSGSGKSSLAFDVLYTEGKRRYVESLSSYARQFLGIAKKPNVKKIEGLCPAVSIDQKTVSKNPRSTVGTVTEIYDYLRVLFARAGDPYCSNCKIKITQETPETITSLLLDEFKDKDILVSAPIVRERKGEFKKDLLEYFNQGYRRFYIDGQLYKFKSEEDVQKIELKKQFKHNIDIVLDSVFVTHEESTRIQESLEMAFSLAKGSCKIRSGEKEFIYSMDRICINCTQSIPELEPRLFSFNSPIGACSSCQGLGYISRYYYYDEDDLEDIIVCDGCNGNRLNKEALSVYIGKKNIGQLCNYSILDLSTFIKNLKLDKTKQSIAKDLLQEITSRLDFLSDVGLPYLTLGRNVRSLSGGESQRIRLATQIGSALSGVVYILDEPSIGLHQSDNDKLIQTLKRLRDAGNTVVVIEHDTDTIKDADYLIEVGPAAGVHGGKILAVGTPKEIAQNQNSIIGGYLSGKNEIEKPKARRQSENFLTLTGASKNNLENVSVEVPLGVFTCVSGLSGSGKSTLVFEELVPAVKKELAFGGWKFGKSKVSDIGGNQATGELDGAQNLLSLVVIDQSPIGRTPRSNPATYLGIFDDVRKLYSTLPESNLRGYKPGRFSFNVKDGRCYECSGEGTIKISMHFLPDVIIKCKVCKGKRYNAKTLEIKYKGKNISDILNMTADEALEYFENHKVIHKKLKLMSDVGLGYITLGQPSTTLSGGEAQRIKLASELYKRGKDTLYVLDEPTTGLHNEDIKKLLKVLNRLIDKGNTVLVIEHNLDVLKTSDYVIDLGPGGGKFGGQIVAQGTPEQVAQNKASLTGKYLSKIL